MSEFYYKELSEKIIGAFYAVYNEFGWGYREKFYQRVALKELRTLGFTVAEQRSIPLLHKQELIGFSRPDFIVENKIIIELKVGNRLVGKDFLQLNEYLKLLDLRLGLLVLISRDGVVPRRVVNIS